MVDISVIIPTRNRAGSLKKTLASLVASKYPVADHEVLVVDNGSTDDTRATAETSIAAHPDHHIRYIFESVPGLLSGRHRGALEAKSELLVFVDDDVKVDEGWLAAIVETFQDPTVYLVGGRNLPNYESTPPDWLEIFWRSRGHRKTLGCLSLLDFGEAPLEIDPGYVWGLNYAIRRQTLFDVGGFHPDSVPKCLQRYQGDGESGLSLKVKQRGLKAVYQPRALVYHQIPNQRLTVEYFEERQFYQGVCNSYTRIRASGGLISNTSGLSLIWRGLLRRARRFLMDLVQRLVPDPYAEIKARVCAAYRAGYAFHQNEVRNDPELLKWVSRADYWDWRLPSPCP